MKFRFILISFLVMIVFCSSCNAAPFFETDPVFPFDEARPANHASSIAALPGGALLVTWFGGSREGMPDVALWAARREPGAEWGAPYVVEDTTVLAEGNSVLFLDSKAKLWLFYVLKYGSEWAAWETCHVFVKTSEDNGLTWSQPRQITKELGYVIRGNALELADGSVMLPVYTESPMQSIVWISGDGFQTYEEYRVPVTTPANLQPFVALIGDNRFLLAARHNTVPGQIWMSLSGDGGRTWTEPKKRKIKNPDSGIAMIALRSGALILVYNDNHYVRTPLVVSMSEDGGKTWPYKKTLETASAEFSYPFLAQAADGIIHLTYTSDGRKFIKHAAFNEDWIKSGGKD